MRLFILGFMGCGKSFSGKRLAKKFDIDFIDLDHFLEEKEGNSIREIFETKGEEYFRNLERECLQAMKNKSMTVISVGGGTPCFFDNMDWMNNNGITVFLDTPVSILANRLKKAMSKRPLLKNYTSDGLEKFITEKLSERKAFYEQCQILYQQKEEGMDVAEDLRKYFHRIVND